MSGNDAEEARWSGVSPSASFTLVRARYCSRSSTTPTSPASAAMCSGVCRVPPSAVSGFALNSSSNLHASTCGGQPSVRCSLVKLLAAFPSPLYFSAPVRNFSTFQFLQVRGILPYVQHAGTTTRSLPGRCPLRRSVETAHPGRGRRRKHQPAACSAGAGRSLPAQLHTLSPPPWYG